MAFVLVNSVAWLAEDILSAHTLPTAAPLLAVDDILGDVAGSELGTRQLAEVTLRRTPAVMSGIAGLKLILVRRSANPSANWP
jgi:hypothetical protein